MFVFAKLHVRWIAALVALVAAVVAAVAAASGQTGATSTVNAATAVTDPGSGTTTATALVFVSGAVAHPGLYRLSTDARVSDAVAAAGGLLPSADVARLPDMAARIHDGRQINVPGPRSGSGRSVAAKLDVNTATLDELAAVPGMPQGLAASIIDYRTTWGPFASMSQLRTDLGLDSATVKAIATSVRVIPAG